MEQIVIRATDRNRIVATRDNGEIEDYIDIRHQFCKDGDWIYTKKGIRFGVSDAPRLLEVVGQLVNGG